MNFRNPSIWEVLFYLLIGCTVRLSAQDTEQCRHAIHFPVNQSFVIYDFPSNEDFFSALHAGLLDVSRGQLRRVDSIVVVGYSSPDGSYARNEKLASERAGKVKRYLHSLLPNVPVAIRAVPEDWNGLAELVVQNGFDKAERVVDICSMDASPEVKERKLRALPGKVYKRLCKDYLPALRRTEVWITLAGESAGNAVGEEQQEALDATEYADGYNTTTVHAVRTGGAGTVSGGSGKGGGKSVAMNARRNGYYARVYRNTLQQRALDIRYNRYRAKARRGGSLGMRGWEYNDRPSWAIGTNLLLLAGFRPDFTHTTTLPNLYLEYYFCKRWSVKGEFAYCDWSYGENGDFQGVSSYMLEPRFWFKKGGCFNGFYVGLYGQLGDFNDRTSKGNYTGTYHSEGLSVGYLLPVYKGLAFELGVRAGYRHADVQRYRTQETCNKECRAFVQDGFELTNCTLGIMYRF